MRRIFGSDIAGSGRQDRHAIPTDALIKLLVADLKPVHPARVSWAPIIASLIGAVAAFVAMLLVLGLHRDIFDARNLGALSIKVLFTLSTVVAAAAYLPQLA